MSKTRGRSRKSLILARCFSSVLYDQNIFWKLILYTFHSGTLQFQESKKSFFFKFPAFSVFVRKTLLLKVVGISVLNISSEGCKSIQRSVSEIFAYKNFILNFNGFQNGGQNFRLSHSLPLSVTFSATPISPRSELDYPSFSNVKVVDPLKTGTSALLALAS